MEMTEYYKIDYRFLMQVTVKTPNERENLFVTFADFFAQYTVLGFQPCVLVGSKSNFIMSFVDLLDGLVMKFNSNKVDNSHMKLDVFRTSNIKPFTKP
jgi:hypothetical protein